MKRPRVKLKTAVPIGDLLGDVLASLRRYADRDLARIWALWETVVGSEVSAHTQPATIKKRQLTVHATSSVWLYQLRFNKKTLIAKLNTALEKEVIDDIRFKIGPVDSSSDADEIIEAPGN